MSECLVAERDRFMELLSKERQGRVHLEAFACSLVQAAYRGYLLRKRLVFIISEQPADFAVRGLFPTTGAGYSSSKSLADKPKD